MVCSGNFHVRDVRTISQAWGFQFLQETFVCMMYVPIISPTTKLVLSNIEINLSVLVVNILLRYTGI